MEYVFVRAGISDDKIKSYSDLLSSVFTVTKKFTPQFLRWQYAENPEGNVIGFDAYYNGKLAAHYVTIPVIYRINNKLTKGLLSLNTATHPDHQGKRLFTTLATKTYEEGIRLGYEFVIGVANANSTHGMIKLNFTYICPLEVKIGIGEIKADYSATCMVKSAWDEKTLRWRLANPSASYYINKNNCIVTPTGKFGIAAELIHLDRPLPGLNLERRNSALKMWMGVVQKKKKRGIFINLPDKLKPVPLNLVFRDLKGSIPSYKKEDFFFELIDFDAY